MVLLIKIFLVDETFIIIIGGEVYSEGVPTIELISTNNSCQIEDFEKSVTDAPMVFLTPIHEELLVCGGSNNKKKCKTLDGNGKWDDFKEVQSRNDSKLFSPRRFSAVATTKDGSFIFGGSSESTSSTYEYMKESKKNWTPGKELIPNGFTQGCAVAVSDNEIWLIGGKEADQKTRILPFFTNNHTFANNSLPPPLKDGRHGHRCSLLPDKSGVMVTGGPNIRSTEIINLKNRTSTRSGRMKEERFLHGIGTLIIDNAPTLVVFGGSYPKKNANNDTVHHYLDTFEKYDQANEKWEFWNGARLNQTKRDFGFATLKPSFKSRLCKNKPQN